MGHRNLEITTRGLRKLKTMRAESNGRRQRAEEGVSRERTEGKMEKKSRSSEHPASYLSSFTGGFPGLELPFGKEGTRKGFVVSPEDPLKENHHTDHTPIVKTIDLKVPPL